jgi:hypothetical protein
MTSRPRRNPSSVTQLLLTDAKIIILLSLTFGTFFGAEVKAEETTLSGGASSFSDSERSQLESQFRSELSQFLYAEQYVLSVIQKSNSDDTDVLPGLARSTNEAAYDVLLVLDAGVSESKAGLARGIIERLGGDKVTVRVASAPVLKVMPPQMLEESRLKNSSYSQPRPEQSGGSDPERGFQASPQRRLEDNPFADEPKGQSQSPGQPAQQPTLFQLVQESPHFALQVLAVLWAAGASLVGLIFLLRKLLERSTGSLPAPAPSQAWKAPSNTVVNDSKPSSSAPSQSPRNNEREGASETNSDRMQLNASSVQESMDSHRPAPDRVATVLTQWIAESEAGLSFARSYFNSLTLHETELISALMHPGDVERIHSAPASSGESAEQEVDPVLLSRRMRAELSKLSSRGQKPATGGPLDFLASMDERLLARVVGDESDQDIAAVCSQLAAHRLQHLLTHLPEARLAAILASLQDLSDLKAEDLTPLAHRLQARRDMLEAALVQPEGLIHSAVHVLEVIEDLGKRTRIAERYLASSDPKLFAELHAKVLLLSDIAFLSKASLRVLAQGIEAQKFAICFVNERELGSMVAKSLHPAYAEMFLAEIFLESTTSNLPSNMPSTQTFLEACRTLSQKYLALVEQLVIEGAEVDSCKRRSREYLASLAKERKVEEQSGDDLEGAA